jgi:hypothetical protein
MRVRNATKEQIESACPDGIKLFKFRPSNRGRGFDFMLRPSQNRSEFVAAQRAAGVRPCKIEDTRPYVRNSVSYFSNGGKRYATCWHGHREFFRNLFKLAPDAIVNVSGRFNTGKPIKYTAENFETEHLKTDRNIGPMIAPVLYSEACDCN